MPQHEQLIPVFKVIFADPSEQQLFQDLDCSLRSSGSPREATNMSLAPSDLHYNLITVHRNLGLWYIYITSKLSHKAIIKLDDERLCPTIALLV